MLSIEGASEIEMGVDGQQAMMAVCVYLEGESEGG